MSGLGKIEVKAPGAMLAFTQQDFVEDTMSPGLYVTAPGVWAMYCSASKTFVFPASGAVLLARDVAASHFPLTRPPAGSTLTITQE